MARKRKRLSKAEKTRRKRARRLASKTYAKAVVRRQGKRSFAAWAAEVCKEGKCAVCGCGERPKLNKDGTVKMTSPKERTRKDGTKFTPKSIPIVVRLNAHHLLPKERYPEFRYEVINGIPLCPVHHKYGKYSAHRNPIWFVVWLARHRPEQYAWARYNMGRETIAA